MNSKHNVVFYPVGNGATSQIITNGGRRVLFDFCHRSTGEDDGNQVIDLKKELGSELERDDRDYYDVVAFSHADIDHIRGSTEFFELKHAEKYKGEGRAKIRELWVPAAMLLEKPRLDKQSEEFAILRREAWYRVMENKGDIKVFSKPTELKKELEQRLKERGEPSDARDHLFRDAGRTVPGFSLSADGVEFFCHSPFIKHCEEGDIVRNDASLVFNVRFRVDTREFNFLQVGDVPSSVFDDIIQISEFHGNQDRLEWNLFNVSHHCSYRSLNEDEKGSEETEPTERMKQLLELGRQDAYIISSSLPIKDDAEAYNRDLPPHIQAKKTYEKYLRKNGGRKFLVSMEEPTKTSPKPIVIEITGRGPFYNKSGTSDTAAVASTQVPRAG